jgi:AraC family transcriptional regulator of arabinose operon
MKESVAESGSVVTLVDWDVPSGWRIVKIDVSRMAETHSPCCQNFVATSAGHFPHAAGHNRSRPTGAGEFIFSWLLQGRGWCEVDGQRHDLQPGHVMVLRPESPHAYRYETDQSFALRWFHCRGNAVAQMAAVLASTSPVVYVGHDASQIALHEEALGALEQVCIPGQLSRGSQLLSALVAQWTWNRHVHSLDEAGTTHQKVDQLLQFLRSHLSESLRPGALAGRLGVSRSHFRALFQRHTGLPPTKWLLEIRLERAHTLLRETSLSIKEVAYAVGISDPLYFSRLFTRRFKSPPSRIRRAEEKRGAAQTALARPATIPRARAAETEKKAISCCELGQA